MRLLLLMGSRRCLNGSPLGREVIVPYFKPIEPPRGRPVGGGGIHCIWGYGGISPHLFDYSES